MTLVVALEEYFSNLKWWHLCFSCQISLYWSLAFKCLRVKVEPELCRFRAQIVPVSSPKNIVCVQLVPILSPQNLFYEPESCIFWALFVLFSNSVRAASFRALAITSVVGESFDNVCSKWSIDTLCDKTNLIQGNWHTWEHSSPKSFREEKTRVSEQPRVKTLRSKEKKLLSAQWNFANRFAALSGSSNVRSYVGRNEEKKLQSYHVSLKMAEKTTVDRCCW